MSDSPRAVFDVCEVSPDPRVWVSCQSTRAVRDLVTAYAPSEVKQSAPKFNLIEAPIGEAINAEVYGLESIQAAERLFKAVGKTNYVWGVDDFVISKTLKLRPLIIELKLSNILFESFFIWLTGLSNNPSFASVAEFNSSCPIKGWEKRLDFATIMQNFGMDEKEAESFSKTKTPTGDPVDEKILRWISKAFLAYRPIGPLTSIFNLCYAMTSGSCNPPKYQDFVDSLLQYLSEHGQQSSAKLAKAFETQKADVSRALHSVLKSGPITGFTLGGNAGGWHVVAVPALPEKISLQVAIASVNSVCEAFENNDFGVLRWMPEFLVTSASADDDFCEILISQVRRNLALSRVPRYVQIPLKGCMPVALYYNKLACLSFNDPQCTNALAIQKSFSKIVLF